MIDGEVDITPGMVVIHDDGLAYQVEYDRRINAAGYEVAHKVGGILIDYVQLEDGSFPAGTKYSRPEDEFRRYFTVASPDRILDLPGLELIITPGTLSEAIELVRNMQTGAVQYRREARDRGDTNEAGRTAERAAIALEHQVSGALQILDTLHQPPDGFHNWSEVLAEDSHSTSE